MSWPEEPVVYKWRPHTIDVAAQAPGWKIPAWAATEARARTTLFIVVALGVRSLHHH